jgi:protein-disulfide isomerase
VERPSKPIWRGKIPMKNIVSIVVALLVGLAGGYAIRGRIGGALPGAPATAARDAAAKPADRMPPGSDQIYKVVVGEGPSVGPADARVTIVEFSDFQCPYCAKAAVEAAQVVQKFPKDVKLVFKQFPLEDHSQASLAAEASLAAQAQDKFWPLHDKMYANFRQINRARILVWATEAGLDLNRFKADLDSHKYAARVHAEEQEGEVAGVEGTPTFFINGKRFNGVFEVSADVPRAVPSLTVRARLATSRRTAKLGTRIWGASERPRRTMSEHGILRPASAPKSIVPLLLSTL